MRSFAAFSDHDFEFFIADLLGEDDGVRYEVFARGPDRGVDLRHFTDPEEAPDVVQCKRYIRSTYSDLKRAAREEAETLSRSGLVPASYRLVTTLELTTANKVELAAILDDHVSGDEDILAAGDLETLLDRHGEVERRHPKLWLTGGTQLDAILNGAIYQRSRQLLEETQEALPRYVETKAFFHARQRLREQKVLVIAGLPGIGKTTLARMLLADAALDEFEPIEISRDAEEANTLYSPDKMQAFYYDDFLGRTFLQDRLVKNEDRRIAQLIRRVIASSTSLFIMTTREHILSQALEFYEELRREGIDTKRYLLELEEYSRLDRARIFYNHIWSSGQLDQGSREELITGRAYERIIDHDNYTPRLIEYITGLSSHSLTEEDRGNYLDFAVEILDDPSQIWRHAFERELDAAQRGMLVALASMQSKVILVDLEEGFRAYSAAAGIELPGGLFESTLRILDDSFISTHIDEGETFAEPANPSIVDFIAEWLAQSPDEALSAAAGARYFTQLESLVRSVVPKLSEPRRAELLAQIAAGLERLIDGEEPRWERVRWGGVDGEVRTSRRWHEILERLIFLASALHDYPLLRDPLEPLFEARLEEETRAWEGGHVVNSATPVSLVAALRRAEHPTLEVSERTKAYLLDNLHSAYDWQQLLRLRKLEPELFELEEMVEIQGQFQTFATELFHSGYSELEDVDEIAQIENVAQEIGVELVDADVEYARDEVERKVSDREEQAESSPDAERLASTYEGSEDEAGAIEALFAHLSWPQSD